MLGAEFRVIREQRGLSRADCARQAGISVDALKSLELNVNYPSLGTLEGLAACLRIRVVIGPDETTIEPVD